ncbi:hypothetical protein, partial [Streptomyces galbus]|uniref:hypothetical protein n=1 Tax=Streptomyces galbus TaxID=33898 RepID=UPI001B341C34
MVVDLSSILWAGSGTIASGGGGSFGLSNAFNCIADHAYVCVSFRIWAAASWRTCSLCAASAARSAAEPVAAPTPSGPAPSG